MEKNTDEKVYEGKAEKLGDGDGGRLDILAFFSRQSKQGEVQTSVRSP